MAELRGFRQRGAQVCLVSPEESRIRQEAEFLQIPWVGLSLKKLRFPFEVCRLAAAFRRERVQIVNPHSSRDSWIAGLAGRIARVPLIIRSRHFDVPIASPLISRVAYCGLADHIITTSPRISEKLRDLFHLPEDRVSTLPTGIDLDLFTPVGDRLDEPWMQGRSGVPRVGMVGVFRWAKGHEILVRAARLLLDRGRALHCVFAGEGPSLKKVRHLVEELGLGGSVTFLGERSDVPRLLRTLDVLVMPSMHEGIPQVGMQALACGTPLIASDVGGLPSIVKHGETGLLVKPGDVEELAASLCRILDKKEEARHMARQGRAFVERHHGLEQMLDALEAIYRRYLGTAG